LSKHFGYALFDERGEPFYIGIGSRSSRPTDHVRDAKRGLRGRRYSKIRRMLRNDFDIPIVIFREGMTLAQAKEMEVALVSVIKRWPDGPLTNISAGGDSPHDVHPNLGKHRPETTKAKISLALTGRVLGPRSPEVIERVRQGLIGRKVPPFTELHRARLAETSRITWRDPDIRASRTGMAGKTHRSDTIEKMQASAAARGLADQMRKIGIVFGKARAGSRWINNGIEQRTISAGEPIPDGFSDGRLPSFWINDGISESKIFGSGLIPDGWQRGRLPGRRRRRQTRQSCANSSLSLGHG